MCSSSMVIVKLYQVGLIVRLPFSRHAMMWQSSAAGCASDFPNHPSTIGSAIMSGTPAGEVRACGGNAMMRASTFEAVGGFRDDLIAGEEPELCVRLRAAGWRIWRLDAEMALHDAAMTHFGQWWHRAIRGGYAYAQGAYLHGAPPERHYVWETRRAWLLGVWLPLACLASGLAFGSWGWAVWMIYPLHMLQKVIRGSGRWVFAAAGSVLRLGELSTVGWDHVYA